MVFVPHVSQRDVVQCRVLTRPLADGLHRLANCSTIWMWLILARGASGSLPKPSPQHLLTWLPT